MTYKQKQWSFPFEILRKQKLVHSIASLEAAYIKVILQTAYLKHKSSLNGILSWKSHNFKIIWNGLILKASLTIFLTKLLEEYFLCKKI